MLGSGILKGFKITLKNFIGSYYDRKRLPTVMYPEEKAPLTENFRSFPFLVHDGEDALAGLRCVACQICERECPPQCILVEKSKDKKPDASGKPQFYPARFEIDISVCMGCGICAEVCPFDSIKMDKVFEVAKPNRYRQLILTRDQLAKPNHYYHQIRPTEAAAVDARLEAARKAAEAKAAAAAKAAAEKAAAAKAAAAQQPKTPETPSSNS